MSLFTVDVIGTMGLPRGNPARLLAAVAQRHNPRPGRAGEDPWYKVASELNRWLLDTTPELTRGVIATVSEYLLFPARDWPENTEAGFTAFEYTDAALAQLGTVGQVVGLSNMSVLGGQALVDGITSQLGHRLSAVYTSFQLGVRKPHHTCWQTVAENHGVQIDTIVHIGDLVGEDIYGALNAGCAGAILVNPTSQVVPQNLLSDPRVVIAADLNAAVTLATEIPGPRRR